ncbi:unnamed protein product [Prunus armeniaca]
MVAQVYVDNIVFGSSFDTLVKEFHEVQQFNGGMFISQTKYAKNLVSKFGLESAKPIQNPMSTSTKLSKDSHGKSVGNIDDRKSTIGGCFYIGNNLVSWSSKKQNCVSLSTAEAEYIVAGSCCI